MNASDLFKAGKLQDAIDAQLKEVKANPGDHGKRLFLFELSAFAGDLDRARRQIDAINYGELERDSAILTYRKLLDAELARRRLLSDGLKPEFLVPPPEHVDRRLDAINRLREQQPAEAATALAKAAELTPTLRGMLNARPFTTLRDADDLFAGVLEVMSQGNYFWVPLDQIVSVTMNAPKFPRDLLWIPAHLEVRDGPDGDVFLPTLYPNSHEHADDQVRLARMTDWKETPSGPVLGVGPHTYLVDEDSLTLLEWRHLEIQEPPTQ